MASLVVRRELARSGRHRAFVNDSPATVGAARSARRPPRRDPRPARAPAPAGAGAAARLLDRFAGDAPDVPRARGRSRRAWHGGAQAELEPASRSEPRERRAQEDLYRFQLSELDAARLEDGEEDALRAERRRLQHAERIGCRPRARPAALLYEDDRRRRRGPPRARPACCASSRRSIPTPRAPPETRRGRRGARRGRASVGVRALRDRANLDPGRLEEIDARLDTSPRSSGSTGTARPPSPATAQEVAERLGRLDPPRRGPRRAGAGASASSRGRARRAADALTAVRTEAAERLAG